MAEIRLEKTLKGRILDIGGGGEGVISRVYTEQVTAIDCCKQELDEIPDVCEKYVMDAQKLEFPNECFDHVTAFYTLFYMNEEEQRRSIAEAARVLKQGGFLWIWDAETAGWPLPHEVELDIDAAGDRIHTTYGVYKDDREQTLERTIRFCRQAGLHVKETSGREQQFTLCAVRV